MVRSDGPNPHGKDAATGEELQGLLAHMPQHLADAWRGAAKAIDQSVAAALLTLGGGGVANPEPPSPGKKRKTWWQG